MSGGTGAHTCIRGTFGLYNTPAVRGREDVGFCTDCLFANYVEARLHKSLWVEILSLFGQFVRGKNVSDALNVSGRLAAPTKPWRRGCLHRKGNTTECVVLWSPSDHLLHRYIYMLGLTLSYFTEMNKLYSVSYLNTYFVGSWCHYISFSSLAFESTIQNTKHSVTLHRTFDPSYQSRVVLHLVME